MSALGDFLTGARVEPNGAVTRARAPSLDPEAPLLVHSLSTLPPTRAGTDALRAMIARGEYLLPRDARPAPGGARWPGHMGPTDLQAGDGNRVFLSVSRTLVVNARRRPQPALAFRFADVAAQGRIMWRPHDILGVYHAAQFAREGRVRLEEAGVRPSLSEVEGALTLRDEASVRALVAAEHRLIAAISDPIYYDDEGRLARRLPPALRAADATAEACLAGWPSGAQGWVPSVASAVYPFRWLDAIALRTQRPLVAKPHWLSSMGEGRVRRKSWDRWELPPPVSEVLLEAPLPMGLACGLYDPSVDHWYDLDSA